MQHLEKQSSLEKIQCQGVSHLNCTDVLSQLPRTFFLSLLCRLIRKQTPIGTRGILCVFIHHSELFAKDHGNVSWQTQKTDSVFHHIFNRNIIHLPFSLPSLQPLHHERKQGAGSPHTAACVTMCVPWHFWAMLITQERIDFSYSIPPLPREGIFSP